MTLVILKIMMEANECRTELGVKLDKNYKL